MRTRVPPILSPHSPPFPERSRIIHSPQIDPLRFSLTRTSSPVPAVTGDDAVSCELSNMYILPPSLPFPFILLPRLVNSSISVIHVLSRIRIIVSKYFRRGSLVFRAAVCFSQPCDRLMYFGARGRSADDRRTEVPPRHCASTWTVTLLAFIAKIVSANFL